MKFSAMMVFALLLLAGVPCAEAQLYLSGNLGAVVAMQSDLTTQSGTAVGEADFSTGYGVSAAIGNEVNILDTPGRAEVEVAYRVNTINAINGVDPNDDISSLSLMLNFLHDYRGFDAFVPFVGVGVGMSQVTAAGEDDTVFAYQAIAGGAMPVTEQVSIDLQYRFFGTDNPVIGSAAGPLEATYMTHNLLLGLRYEF